MPKFLSPFFMCMLPKLAVRILDPADVGNQQSTLLLMELLPPTVCSDLLDCQHHQDCSQSNHKSHSKGRPYWVMRRAVWTELGYPTSLTWVHFCNTLCGSNCPIGSTAERQACQPVSFQIQVIPSRNNDGSLPYCPLNFWNTPKTYVIPNTSKSYIKLLLQIQILQPTWVFKDLLQILAQA